MVLGATSKIKPNQLNIEETYNWLKKLKLVNKSYRNIIIDESDEMLQRMRSVRDSLLSPQVVLRVDLPLDVYIDRSLDGTSNNNGTDNDGIRFRGQIMSNEESMMEVDLQRVPSLTPTHNVHSLEEVNEVLINSSFEQLQNTENRQGNLLLKFSCFRHYV